MMPSSLLYPNPSTTTSRRQARRRTAVQWSCLVWTTVAIASCTVESSGGCALAFAPPVTATTRSSRQPRLASSSSALPMSGTTPPTTPTPASIKQPTPVLVQAAQELLGSSSDSGSATALAAAMLGATVLLSSPFAADAAMSGGRMGGSFSSPSRSMSMPSRSSYSGGGGYRGGYGGGYGGGYRSGPTIVAPIVAPIGGFGYGYGAGYGAGVGAISYQRGPGLIDLLFLGGIGWFALSAVTSAMSGGSRAGSTLWSEDDYGGAASSTVLGPGTSVVRLTVALDVPNRDDPNSLLSALDRLARTANTNSRSGVQNLTSQVAVELLRRKNSIQSASSTYKHFRDDSSKGDKAAQRLFNQWSVEQRSKFEQETVSKFGGIDSSSKRSSASSSNDGGKATMAVVTLVLSIAGDSTAVDTVRSLSDVEGALRKIAADVKVDDCLTGAEILWTPEDRSEVLSRGDVVADYPELRTV